MTPFGRPVARNGSQEPENAPKGPPVVWEKFPPSLRPAKPLATRIPQNVTLWSIRVQIQIATGSSVFFF